MASWTTQHPIVSMPTLLTLLALLLLLQAWPSDEQPAPVDDPRRAQQRPQHAALAVHGVASEAHHDEHGNDERGVPPQLKVLRRGATLWLRGDDLQQDFRGEHKDAHHIEAVQHLPHGV